MSFFAALVLTALSGTGEVQNTGVSPDDAISICRAAESADLTERASGIVSTDGVRITDNDEIAKIHEASKEGQKRILRYPPPPPSALMRRIRRGDYACVVVVFDVTEKGRTQNIEVLTSATTLSAKRSPLSKFETSAIKAVKDWRYIPLRYGDQKYRREGVVTLLSFDFR